MELSGMDDKSDLNIESEVKIEDYIHLINRGTAESEEPSWNQIAIKTEQFEGENERYNHGTENTDCAFPMKEEMITLEETVLHYNNTPLENQLMVKTESYHKDDGCSGIHVSEDIFLKNGSLIKCEEQTLQPGIEETALSQHNPGGNAEKYFQCDVCSKRFALKSRLARHVRRHVGKKDFECTICGKRFSEKRNLNYHMLLHYDRKDFQCDVCQKRFTLKSCLNLHMLTHSNQKDFQCDVCRKQFLRKYHLKDHMMTHTGQKDFECDVCRKRFSRKASLKDHMVTHSGRKGFQCQICQQLFAFKCSLTRHVRRRHPTYKASRRPPQAPVVTFQFIFLNNK